VIESLPAGAPLVDVAFAACTVLERAGETAVLCGGSAAAFYVPDLYSSLDIDFVVEVGAAPHVVDRDAFRAWTERELAADRSYDASRIGRFFTLLGRG
jgi:hypothetical protein